MRARLFVAELVLVDTLDVDVTCTRTVFLARKEVGFTRAVVRGRDLQCVFRNLKLCAI